MSDETTKTLTELSKEAWHPSEEVRSSITGFSELDHPLDPTSVKAARIFFKEEGVSSPTIRESLMQTPGLETLFKAVVMDDETKKEILLKGLDGMKEITGTRISYSAPKNPPCEHDTQNLASWYEKFTVRVSKSVAHYNPWAKYGCLADLRLRRTAKQIFQRRKKQ
jgi:hypothetical protein